MNQKKKNEQTIRYVQHFPLSTEYSSSSSIITKTNNIPPRYKHTYTYLPHHHFAFDKHKIHIREPFI